MPPRGEKGERDVSDYTLPATIATILGIIAPLIVSYLRQAAWPRWAVQVTLFSVSIGAAVVALVIGGQIQPDADITIELIVGYAAWIATVAQFIYNTFLRAAIDAPISTQGPLVRLTAALEGTSSPKGGDPPLSGGTSPPRQ